jgi:SAM-dependent methyltransferase
MNKNFEDYSQYYDLMYEDKDYTIESLYLINKVKKIKPKVENVLELGCGSGSHAKYLIKKWNNIYGIDLSKKMIEIAKNKKISNFHPTVGNITKFKFKIKFDVIISLFHVISYLNNDDDILSCFDCVNKHLEDDGLFIFDFWYTPAVYSLGPDVKIKRYENKQVEITRISEPIINNTSSIVNVNFEIFIKNKESNQISKLTETHNMRHFTINELKLLASQSGLQIINYEEYMSSKLLSLNSWGACITLKKI